MCIMVVVRARNIFGVLTILSTMIMFMGMLLDVHNDGNSCSEYIPCFLTILSTMIMFMRMLLDMHNDGNLYSEYMFFILF